MGAECLICCVAGSDGQLHMAFALKALLMLEAAVWAGAAGSVCQRIRDRQGGGRAAATCPPFSGDGKASEECAAKNVTLFVSSSAVIFCLSDEIK